MEDKLKKNPAQIIGLAECQTATEELLRSTGAPGSAAVAADEFDKRHSYEYLTLRGAEDSSVLLGVRAAVANKLELLHWERRREGQYATKPKSSRGGGRSCGRVQRVAYSRALIGKVYMDGGVAHMGSEQVVMVVHMHNTLANGKWPLRLVSFWDWLQAKLQEFGVSVLMGDFNMSLFELVPQLRSRGVQVDVAGWYPWKTPAGLPFADSCGVFFIGKPGKCDPFFGVDHLHDDDPMGHPKQGRPRV